MNRLCWIGVVCGCLLATGASAQTQREADEQTLKAQKIPIDAKGLIEFFEAKSPRDGEAKELEAMVRKLGSEVYAVRETAKKDLIKRGPPALPFLRAGLTNSGLEAKQRAELCIKAIEETMQFGPISAAARVLAEHKDPRAAEVLFNFLPTIGGDAMLEDEVLNCVGRLSVSPEKVDALLLKALKDPMPLRRTSAAYLVGRRGGIDHRDQLRAMLADNDPRVPVRIAEGLFGKRPQATLAEALTADEKLLTENKVDLKEASLLEYFKKRTLNPDDQKRLRDLVKKLGSNIYSIREPARKELLEKGIVALPFLREALSNTPLETKRRSELCIAEISTKNNPAVPIAAAHLLTRPPLKKSSPAETIRTLLAYIPFADDDNVEEEILTCLTLLSLREPAIEPELLKALADVSPVRRSAAAYVLGHVGTKTHIAKAAPLLDDPHAIVRLRAAQGMLAARDKAALPTFVKLLTALPDAYVPRVEEVLHRVAEDKAPTIDAADSREKAAKVWTKWLDDNKARIDLTSIHDRESYLGLVTICEYDNQFGNINGQVFETARGGPKRWTISGANNALVGAMDAHSLPNGRVLIAENSANRVTERDNKGDIKWQHNIPANPIACQRLPNGNTFIACYNMILEVKPDKSEVYRFSQITPGVGFHIFSAHKARNGHIVFITSQGHIYEVEAPAAGATTPKSVYAHVTTNTLGNWCSVELQPNGNFLVAAMNPGNVREIDRKGTEVWSKPFAQAFRATRLPNGNVLVAGMNTRQVAEMDRSGAIRWTVSTTGRPWSVHYR